MSVWQVLNAHEHVTIFMGDCSYLHIIGNLTQFIKKKKKKKTTNMVDHMVCAHGVNTTDMSTYVDDLRMYKIVTLLSPLAKRNDGTQELSLLFCSLETWRVEFWFYEVVLIEFLLPNFLFHIYILDLGICVPLDCVMSCMQTRRLCHVPNYLLSHLPT